MLRTIVLIWIQLNCRHITPVGPSLKKQKRTWNCKFVMPCMTSPDGDMLSHQWKLYKDRKFMQFVVGFLLILFRWSETGFHQPVFGSHMSFQSDLIPFSCVKHCTETFPYYPHFCWLQLWGVFIKFLPQIHGSWKTLTSIPFHSAPFHSWWITRISFGIFRWLQYFMPMPYNSVANELYDIF